ncbi:hypothetical protein D3C83_00910 [compost metagenome]
MSPSIRTWPATCSGRSVIVSFWRSPAISISFAMSVPSTSMLVGVASALLPRSSVSPWIVMLSSAVIVLPGCRSTLSPTRSSTKPSGAAIDASASMIRCSSLSSESRTDNRTSPVAANTVPT